MSCRRGTPRNDCSCCKSLAEKVRELYQRCANAIKSINGINPDGANNFDILPGAGIQVNPRANGIEIIATGAAPEDVVKSVNGTTPDSDGDVQINTGLLTVNSEPPDADGEFSITAGSGIQINADTNGIEIENTAQGATYTGIAPITINADNEISLQEWTQVSGHNWSGYVSSGRITEDLLLISAVGKELTYIKKGDYASDSFRKLMRSDVSLDNYDTSVTNYYFSGSLSTILSSSSNISLTQQKLKISGVGGVNEKVELYEGSSTYTKLDYFTLYRRV